MFAHTFAARFDHTDCERLVSAIAAKDTVVDVQLEVLLNFHFESVSLAASPLALMRFAAKCPRDTTGVGFLRFCDDSQTPCTDWTSGAWAAFKEAIVRHQRGEPCCALSVQLLLSCVHVCLERHGYSRDALPLALPAPSTSDAATAVSPSLTLSSAAAAAAAATSAPPSGTLFCSVGGFGMLRASQFSVPSNCGTVVVRYRIGRAFAVVWALLGTFALTSAFSL
jgi:hypothetical protein